MYLIVNELHNYYSWWKPWHALHNNAHANFRLLCKYYFTYDARINYACKMFIYATDIDFHMTNVSNLYIDMSHNASKKQTFVV